MCSLISHCLAFIILFLVGANSFASQSRVASGALPAQYIPMPKPRPEPEPEPDPEEVQGASEAEVAEEVEPQPQPILPEISFQQELQAGAPVLTFAWEKKPALSVFKGHDKWWLVFDEKAAIKLPERKKDYIYGIKSMAMVEHESATIISLKADSDLSPKISYKENTWAIAMVRHPLYIKKSAIVQLPPGEKKRIKISAPKLHEKVLFEDPETKEQFIVAPSEEPGVGVSQQTAFPEGVLIPTAQGVVLRRISEDLSYDVAPNAVVIYHQPELSFTTIYDRRQKRKKRTVSTLLALGEASDEVKKLIKERSIHLPRGIKIDKRLGYIC